jgi:hypothetical protein
MSSFFEHDVVMFLARDANMSTDFVSSENAAAGDTQQITTVRVLPVAHKQSHREMQCEREREREREKDRETTR